MVRGTEWLCCVIGATIERHQTLAWQPAVHGAEQGAPCHILQLGQSRPSKTRTLGSLNVFNVMANKCKHLYTLFTKSHTHTHTLIKINRTTHPQIARTAEMRTDGGWVSCRPLTVACRNCCISSADMAAVKRLAAHRARPSKNGEAAEVRYMGNITLVTDHTRKL